MEMVKMSKKPEDIYEKYSPQFVVDETGKKNMVLLKMNVFNDLLEDLHDLAVVAERREDNMTPYEEFRKELKSEGKL